MNNDRPPARLEYGKSADDKLQIHFVGPNKGSLANIRYCIIHFSYILVSGLCSYFLLLFHLQCGFNVSSGQ